MNIKKIPGDFWVPGNDTHIGKWQMETGRLDHDRFLVPLACSFIKPGSLVIDCGAFNGDHTIAYSEVVEHGIVVALEPGETAYACLVENVNHFKFKNVKAMRVAVGAHSAVARHETQGNLGSSFIGGCENGAGDISIVTLDAVEQFFEKTPLSFVKLDVEGMEYEALCGAENILHSKRPIWLIEINQATLERNHVNPDQIWEMMNAHDYRIRIAQPDCKRGDPMYDIICEPF